MAKVEQKKSMLYFSGGLTKQGIENEASIRAATNECVKDDTAMYAVDIRGLQALNPVGDASQGSRRGTGAYSGASMQGQLNSNFSSQETLGTLASDTGGKLFTDSNDFAPAFQQVQHDTEAYYIVGYHSTNPGRDGTLPSSHRHAERPSRRQAGVSPRLLRPGGLPARQDRGPRTRPDRADAQRTARHQRRRLPPGPLLPPGDGKFYIPISLVVPGSQIHSSPSRDKDKATIDILGQVKNAQSIAVGQVRQTVNLAVDANQQVQKKNVQYSTGFTLAPGKYHLKFVVRENQSGNMGSFETDIQVPDMKKMPLKLSSVVMSSQRTPNTCKKDAIDPLVRDGQEWVPNVPHVVRQDQHLYFLYEVYSPAPGQGLHRRARHRGHDPGLDQKGGRPVRVLTSIEFLLGGVKVYETPHGRGHSHQHPGARCRQLPVRRPARRPQAGHLRLPGQRHRRRRRQLHLPPHGPAHHPRRRALRNRNPGSLATAGHSTDASNTRALTGRADATPIIEDESALF